MKIQRVVRAQGEFAKVNQDFRDGDTMTILDEGQIITGDYGDRHVFKIQTPKNGEKNLSFNQTSLNNLVEEYGEDSVNWMGKTVKAWVVRQSVSGSLKNICYLTGPTWEMVEDDKGNLKFAKPNNPKTVSGEDYPQGSEDVAF